MIRRLNLSQMHRLLLQPWAVSRDTLRAFTQLLLSGERATEDAPAPAVESAPLPENAAYVPLNFEGQIAVKKQPLPALADDVHVLLVWGILGRAWSATDQWWLDPVDVDELVSAIAATPAGSTVVLWFRSPGGIVTGVPETAAALRALGKQRTLLAFSDDLCASAAYWLASQCQSIIATPTADIGSIGVYVAYYDFCAMLEERGVKLELFEAGDMKTAGLLGDPLNDKERGHLQAGVDESYKQFRRDVTNMRALDNATMQGQVQRGKNAQDTNLVDAFAPSAAAFFAGVARGKYRA